MSISTQATFPVQLLQIMHHQPNYRQNQIGNGIHDCLKTARGGFDIWDIRTAISSHWLSGDGGACLWIGGGVRASEVKRRLLDRGT